MDSLRVIVPPRSPMRGTAGQRAAERLFGKPPSWKDRFRELCKDRLQELRHNAQISNRFGNPENGSLSQAMEVTSHSEPNGSTNDGHIIEEEERLWMQQFIEQELSTFEDIDADHEINYHLSLEEHAELFDDLHAVLYGNTTNYGMLN